MEPERINKNLDTSCINDDLTILKVPKYIGDSFDACNENSVVAQLIEYSDGSKEIKVLTDLSITSANAKSLTSDSFKIVSSKFDKVDSLVVSDVVDGSEDQAISVAGKIMSKFDSQPIYSKTELLKKSMTTKPVSKTILYDTAIGEYIKPISYHTEDYLYEKSMKEKGKRFRAEKDDVIELLLNLFEKHEYIHFRDIISATNQPAAYLRDLVPEVAELCRTDPFRNMWTLKATYKFQK